MSSEDPHLPLSDAVQEYLQWLDLDRHRSEGTIAGYRADLWRFQTFTDQHRGDPRVGTLDRELIRAYQRSLAKTTIKKDGKFVPLAPATRIRRLVALRSFLRFSLRERWISEDLAATIDLPKAPERLPKPLQSDHRDHLVSGITGSSPQDLRNRALVLLFLSTGARVSELLRLNRSDWGSDRLVVRGKGDKERPVIVSDRARAAMDLYLAARSDPSPALLSQFPTSSHTTT